MCVCVHVCVPACDEHSDLWSWTVWGTGGEEGGDGVKKHTQQSMC